MTVALADYLVKKGIPFREAHHYVGQAVKIAIGKKLTAAFGGPLLALFVLALFSRRSNWQGVLLSVSLATIVTLVLMYQQEDYRQAVKWISEGSMIAEPLVTKHFPFAQYEDAYRFIEKQGDKTLKVVIDLD